MTPISKTKAYKAWQSAKQRCFNKRSTSYRNYGGRGIIMCDQWTAKGGFWAFLADMGESPEGSMLDRIDNNGPYAPDNCRWATKEQSNRNKRVNRFYSLEGESKILKDWALDYGIPYKTVQWRVCQERWPLKKALTVPVRTRRLPWVTKARR